MTTLIDTSALYALMDASDPQHETATAWFDGPGAAEKLITHNYVVVETAALVQRRLGREASRVLFDALLPRIEVVFVHEALHNVAARLWLSLGRRQSSLVDHVSFELIKHERIAQAFAFDDDFASQHIATVPSAR
ncbi:MAG: type II toxin-antitoxin system VapC family toxin [Candidatus Dormibacteria bacterium]